MLCGELLGEPCAGVDGVEFHVAEGIADDGLAGGFHGAHDVLDAGAFGDEDVHVVVLVHDLGEAGGLGIDIDGHLRDVDGVDGEALLGEADFRQPLLGVEFVLILHGRWRR